MSEAGEERRSLWTGLFDSSRGSERERRALEYIVHRMKEDARLHDVVEEEYVRRNLTQAQIEDIVSNPRIIESVHERLHEAFSSGELDPDPRPE